jgi:hypothetical protein
LTIRRYIVRAIENDTWSISIGCAEVGPYLNEDEAVRCAIDAASRTCQANSGGAEVVVHRADGTSWTEWTYGILHRSDGKPERN